LLFSGVLSFSCPGLWLNFFFFRLQTLFLSSKFSSWVPFPFLFVTLRELSFREFGWCLNSLSLIHPTQAFRKNFWCYQKFLFVLACPKITRHPGTDPCRRIFLNSYQVFHMLYFGGILPHSCLNLFVQHSGLWIFFHVAHPVTISTSVYNFLLNSRNFNSNFVQCPPPPPPQCVFFIHELIHYTNRDLIFHNQLIFNFYYFLHACATPRSYFPSLEFFYIFFQTSSTSSIFLQTSTNFLFFLQTRTNFHFFFQTNICSQFFMLNIICFSSCELSTCTNQMSILLYINFSFIRQVICFCPTIENNKTYFGISLILFFFLVIFFLGFDTVTISCMVIAYIHLIICHQNFFGVHTCYDNLDQIFFLPLYSFRVFCSCCLVAKCFRNNPPPTCQPFFTKSTMMFGQMMITGNC